MKKLIATAALAALCACSDNDAARDDVAAVETTETAAPAADKTVAAAGPAGTYEYERDGVRTVATLNTDGTYADTRNGAAGETGTWVDRNGQLCFDLEGASPESCWTTTPPDPEGAFTATDADGTTMTVRRTR